MLKSLSERADKVRNKSVEPEEDNMLKITNDSKKLALDQRLINLFFQMMKTQRLMYVLKMYFLFGIRQKKKINTISIFRYVYTKW